MSDEKENFKNNDLDKLGVELLKAGELESRELEEIVSAPFLFSSIKARIRSEESVGASQQPADRTGRLAAWKLTAAASSVTAVLLTAFIGIAIFRGDRQVPEIVSEIAPPPMAVDFSVTIAPEPEKAVVPSARPKTITISNLIVPRPKPRKHAIQSKPVEANEVPAFYALTYIADAEETARDAQVIRVELPRASLFALGVNVPLENDSDVIKTDLLVGSNGVASAIRLVE